MFRGAIPSGTLPVAQRKAQDDEQGSSGSLKRTEQAFGNLCSNSARSRERIGTFLQGLASSRAIDS
jgi:hypothetical protein